MHTNGKVLKYKYASGVPQSVKDKVGPAIALWNGTTPATVEATEDPAGSGTIIMTDSLDYNTAAQASMACDPSNGHQFAWIISINSNSLTGNATPLTVKKIAREIGHVIGLCTVSGSNNTNKIMYSGNGKHYRRCSYCHGKKFLSTESCTYNNSGVCTKCGSLQGSGTEGVTLPEVTGMSLWEEQRRAFRFLA